MSVADRVVRWSTALDVLGVVLVAAVVSYEHASDLLRAHGETGWTARLIPLTVDGVIYGSWMTTLDSAPQDIELVRLSLCEALARPGKLWHARAVMVSSSSCVGSGRCSPRTSSTRTCCSSGAPTAPSLAGSAPRSRSSLAVPWPRARRACAHRARSAPRRRCQPTAGGATSPPLVVVGLAARRAMGCGRRSRRFEPERDDVRGHHRPVLRPGDVIQAERLPEHHAGVLDGPVGLGPGGHAAVAGGMDREVAARPALRAPQDAGPCSGWVSARLWQRGDPGGEHRPRPCRQDCSRVARGRTGRLLRAPDDDHPQFSGGTGWHIRQRVGGSANGTVNVGCAVTAAVPVIPRVSCLTAGSRIARVGC